MQNEKGHTYRLQYVCPDGRQEIQTPCSPVVLHFFRQLQGVSYFDTSSVSYSGLAVKWKVFRIEGNYSSRSCQLCKKSNLTYGVSL